MKMSRASVSVLEALWLMGPMRTAEVWRWARTVPDMGCRLHNLRKAGHVGRDGDEWFLTSRGFLRLEAS